MEIFQGVYFLIVCYSQAFQISTNMLGDRRVISHHNIYVDSK